MSKRRISKGAVTKIGEERIATLTKMSIDALSEGRNDLARRYVELAKKIGMKTKMKMPEGFRYCKKCLIPLIPGNNCTVRLTGGKVVTRCQDCGALKRKPYIKERDK